MTRSCTCPAQEARGKALGCGPLALASLLSNISLNFSNQTLGQGGLSQKVCFRYVGCVVFRFMPRRCQKLNVFVCRCLDGAALAVVAGGPPGARIPRDFSGTKIKQLNFATGQGEKKRIGNISSGATCGSSGLHHFLGNLLGTQVHPQQPALPAHSMWLGKVLLGPWLARRRSRQILERRCNEAAQMHTTLFCTLQGNPKKEKRRCLIPGLT